MNLERDHALDELRGLAVIWIHFVDIFYLLWNGQGFFDFCCGYLFDEVPVYFLPPILFAFSTGLALTYWRDRHYWDGQYLLRRFGLLLLSGLILSYYVDFSFEAWGLFEMICLVNFIIFIINSERLAIIGIVLIVLLNYLIPPHFTISFQTFQYFKPIRIPSHIVSQALVSGLFPTIPFLAFAFWGYIIGKHRKKFIKFGLIPLGIGLILRFVDPFVYAQFGNTYSTSIIFLSMGMCSLLLYAFDKVRIPFLNLYGQNAWRITFWRYPILYFPFTIFGYFRKLNNEIAFFLSVIISISQIVLISDKIIKK